MLEDLQVGWALKRLKRREDLEGDTKFLRGRGLILGRSASVEKRGPEEGFRTAVFPTAGRPGTSLGLQTS